MNFTRDEKEEIAAALRLAADAHLAIVRFMTAIDNLKMANEFKQKAKRAMNLSYRITKDLEKDR